MVSRIASRQKSNLSKANPGNRGVSYRIKQIGHDSEMMAFTEFLSQLMMDCLLFALFAFGGVSTDPFQQLVKATIKASNHRDTRYEHVLLRAEGSSEADDLNNDPFACCSGRRLMRSSDRLARFRREDRKQRTQTSRINK